MKNVFLSIMCMASLVIITACGGNNTNKNASGETAEVKKEAKATKSSNLSVGERYAFAGLSSADIVPSFGREITDSKDTDANGVTKAITFFGYGNDREPFSDKVYDEYCRKLFAKLKSLSEDGKLYKVNTLDFKVREEVAELGEMKKWGKDGATFCFAYPYNGQWVLANVKYRKSFSGKTEGTYGLDIHVQTFHKQ